MNKLRLIFLFLSLISFAFSLDLPDYTGFVNDYAGIIDYNSKQQINNIIYELERKTGAEVAVVTLKSLQGENIEDFTNRLFEKWGVGKKGKNNGIMILVAIEDRLIRIEIGYGLEGIIPDAKAGRIIREIITPLFKQAKFGEGILNAVYVIAEEIASDAGVKLNIEKRNVNYAGKRKLTKSDLFWFLFFMFFIMPVFIRHPWLLLFFLSSGRGGRYYGGGGFGGGGFGGFGGGLSGGGGATGRW